MWEFLSRLAGLILLIAGEYLSGRAQARANQEKFEIDEKKFHEMVLQVIRKREIQMAADSKGAGKAWDAADH